MLRPWGYLLSEGGTRTKKGKWKLVKEGPSIASAAAIQYGVKVVVIFLQLSVQAILGRLLTPSEFGDIAIVMVFVSFFLLLSDLGIGPAIIQFTHLQREQLRNLFAISIVLALCLSLLFLISIPVIVAFYDNAQLTNYLIVSIVVIVVTTLNAVPNGVMLRERRFGAIGIRTLVANFGSSVAAVLAALNGWGIYAIIFQAALAATITLIWNACTYRGIVWPKFGGSLETLRSIIRYSGFQSIWSVINYFSRNLDNLLVGRYFGAVPLGYYDRAYKLSTFPVLNVAGVLSGILQPFLAGLQNDRERLYRRYIEILGPVSSIGALIAVICISCPREIILLFYGGQWSGAIVIFEILSISVFFQFINNLITPLLQSAGRTDVLFWNGAIATFITVIAILIGIIGHNLVVLAWAVSTAYVLHTIVFTYTINRVIFIKSIKRYVHFFAPEAVFAACSLVVAKLLFERLYLTDGLLISLSGKIIVIFVAFGLMLKFSNRAQMFKQLAKQR